MRISDWSSDVCSSDLIGDLVRFHPASQRPFRADREERARRLVLRDDGQGLRHRQARLRGHLVELELAIDEVVMLSRIERAEDAPALKTAYVGALHLNRQPRVRQPEVTVVHTPDPFAPEQALLLDKDRKSTRLNYNH